MSGHNPRRARRAPAIDGQPIGQFAAGLAGLRLPLENFQRACRTEQLARFAAMIAAPAAASLNCGGDASAAVERTISLIEGAVQPTATQRDALNAFKGALSDAARDMQADCAAPLPPTELGRLGMIEARLDATRRAVRSIEAALTKFEICAQ